MKVNLSEKEIAVLIKCIDSAIMFWISHQFDLCSEEIKEKKRLESISLNGLKAKFCNALMELSKKEEEQ